MANRLFTRNLLACGQQISILERYLEESEFDSNQPVETFVEIDTPLAIVKTITRANMGGTKLFDGINIVSDATHIFCILYSDLYEIEHQNYFVQLKLERYKILSITNVDERDEIIVMQGSKRGDVSKEASKA